MRRFKIELCLLIIKLSNLSEVFYLIRDTLNFTEIQTLRVLSYLIDNKFITNKSGEIILTEKGNSILRDSKLDGISFDDLFNPDTTEFINEDILDSYIPK